MKGQRAGLRHYGTAVVLVLALLSQRHLTRGLTVGGVTG